MRTWIIAGLALALAGCSDIPPSHTYLLVSDKLEEMNRYTEYRDRLSDGDIALLDGKINFRETYFREIPACRHVEAEVYPTPAESAALRRWAAVRANYFSQYHRLELRTAEGSQKVYPLARQYIAALDQDLAYSTALINALADGEMTYCEFATRQKSSTIASSERAAPLRNEMIAAMKEDNYYPNGGIAFGASPVGIFTTGSSGPAGAGR